MSKIQAKKEWSTSQPGKSKNVQSENWIIHYSMLQSAKTKLITMHIQPIKFVSHHKQTLPNPMW
jgi:hypothetical protein